jgi:hypothetical protein
MPARKLQKKFGTRKKPSSKKVTSSGRDLLGREKKRLQRIADLQAKYPNVSRDMIVDSMRYGKGKNPDQFQKSLINSIKREKILRGAGKGAKFVAGKSLLPVAALQFLQGSPAGAESDVVPELTPAERKKQKEHIASQIHSGEYADAFPQRKKRGGKVKKKKKKTRSKPNKIMVGYKAGGKV